MGSLIGWLVCLILVGYLCLSGVTIVESGNQAIVELLGKYNGKKLNPGFHFIIPVCERVAYQYTLREQILDIPAQSCISRDRISITVDAIIFWQVIALEQAYYNVENIQDAMVHLSLTQIRIEVEARQLDETLTQRTQIGELLRDNINRTANAWGIKANQVELRNINRVS